MFKKTSSLFLSSECIPIKLGTLILEQPVHIIVGNNISNDKRLFDFVSVGRHLKPKFSTLSSKRFKYAVNRKKC